MRIGACKIISFVAMLSACDSGLITDYGYATPNFDLVSTLTLHFSSNSIALDSAARMQIDEAVSDYCLAIVQDLRLAGHADAPGTPAYNLKLSHERAEVVRRALIKRGVPAANIRTQAYGAERPAIASRPGTSEWRDRRVDIHWTPHPSVHPLARARYTRRCGELKLN